MDGERGLADAAGAGDGADGQRVPVDVVQEPVQGGQFVAAPGERGGGGRQMGGHDGGRCEGDVFGGRHQRRGVGEDLLVQLLQGRTGVDAEFPREQPAGLAVGLQGLGAAAAPVLRQHQLGDGLFAQRVLADEPA